MVGVFDWNDLDVFFTFNVDVVVKLSLSQCHKILTFFQHHAIDGYHFVLRSVLLV